MGLIVACVKTGNMYGPEYVNKLYAMVARNLPDGMPGRFVCFTDDADGLLPQVETRPIMGEGLEGWWAKLWLFSDEAFELGDRIVYLDLDTVIIGPLDDIVSYDGPFAALRDFYRPEALQSSVMSWESGYMTDIWDRWEEAGRPIIDGGDQEWIRRVVMDFPHFDRRVDFWQDLFLGVFCSYKRDCHPYPPTAARVVVFHGEPRPHNCGQPWVAAMWSEGDAATFHLAMERNVPLSQIRAQIETSEKFPHERLRSMPSHDRAVLLVGGGPSVKASLPIIRDMAKNSDVWAMNGSYDWLIANGIMPDAMVMIDARQSNVRFVKDQITRCWYYLASQCHPDVWERLDGYPVVRVDLDVMGDCGTTVGTHAMCIAFCEGFRKIHLFGFDSSYLEADGHAYPQIENEGERVIDVVAGGRSFRAAPWMMQQVKDFQSLAPDMMARDCEIVVHGFGMLPHVAREMMRPSAADQRAKAILSRLPEERGCLGVEVGVFTGALSSRLLKGKQNLALILVDSWEGDGAAYAVPDDDWHGQLSKQDQDRFFEETKRAVGFAGDRVSIMKMRSAQAARELKNTPGSPIDFVFLDADHSYAGCAMDISAWWPLVRTGGLLCGHDYDNPVGETWGVKRAVDQFAAVKGRAVELGENFTWFIRKG